MMSGTNCNDANRALLEALKYGSLSQVVCDVVVLETTSVEPTHRVKCLGHAEVPGIEIKIL